MRGYEEILYTEWYNKIMDKENQTKQNKNDLQKLIDSYKERLKRLIFIDEAIQKYGIGVLNGWIGELNVVIRDLENIKGATCPSESGERSQSQQV
jgi:hypothetical protein